MDFKEMLNELNIELTDEMEEKLLIYYNTLIEWNKVMNLTSITDKDEVYLKHFYDSMTLAKVIDNKNYKICDIGAGAGFPSIPLKIVMPNLDITIVDSLNKRINFLNELIKKLDLKNVRAIHQRAEEHAVNNYEKYDIVTARAVARLNILDELCMPLVKVNGSFISLKADAKEEIEEAKKGIKILGGNIVNIIEFKLPIEESNRTIIEIKKIKNTNKKYPRSFSKIKNNPL